MDFIEKCKAAGIGDGSVYEGYPVVHGRWIRKTDGKLNAFFKEDLKPFEEPREDTAFPKVTLDKIQAIEDGELELLTQTERDAIAAAEAKEIEQMSIPALIDIVKRLEAVEAELAK